MESNNSEPKGGFRKLSNDAVNRKYRRRSPSSSSSAEGSKRSSSPIRSSRKDDDLDRSRQGQFYRQSDRPRSHHKHEDYTKRTNDDDRGHLKLSSHYRRELRGHNYSDYSSRNDDHRSRDYRDRYEESGHRSEDRERATSSFKDKDDNRSGARDRYKEFYRGGRDEKGDRRGSYRSDRSPAYEESRSNRNESNSRKDSSGRRLKDGEKYTKEERKQYEDHESSYCRETEDKHGPGSPAKKSKFTSMDQNSEKRKDGLDPANLADPKLSSSSKQGQDSHSGSSLEQGVRDSDIDTAKIAAMKAAELVNRNLIGTGIMTTDQKKKLLWGNKTSTISTEESTHRWDTSLFGDRERQEKFNKLMGVKGDVKVAENKPDVHDAEKQRELQMDLEKQYTAGLRRRDGRTVGLGL